MATQQEVIQDFGDYELIFGNNAKNTLTGSDKPNIFLHQGSNNDVIKDFNPSEDIIVLAEGKVAQSLKSDDGNNVILKISKGKKNLGTITIENVGNNDINVYDEDKINDAKEVFHEFTIAYLKSAIKTFDEDEDVQSILNDGENSAVLAEIKKINPELAKSMAESLQHFYETAIYYMESNSISSNASADIAVDTEALDSFNNIMSTVDAEATVLSELANMGKANAIAGGVANGISKYTGSAGVVLSAGTCMLYNSMLQDKNVQAWKEAGSQGDTTYQKLALIREQNPEIFDEAVKSDINLAFSVGGFVAVTAMGALGVVGAPVIATAAACALVPIALGWAYDKFIAPKFKDEADKFNDALKNNFDTILDEEYEASGEENPSNRLKDAIESGSDYGKTNYEKYVAPHYYHLAVRNSGYKISNRKSNYIMYKYGNQWGHPRIYKSDGNWEYYYINYDYPTVSGDNLVLNGSSSNDYIDNGGDKVTINSGAGDDSIENDGYYSTINGGAGDDSIRNYGSNVTIIGGDGNDSINNYYTASQTAIDGGAGSDEISNNGSNSSISGGAGNDEISNNGSNSSISGGAGNDSIWNGGSNVTISGGDGDDFVDNANAKNSVKIDLGAGNDSLWNHASNSTIIGGEGNDSLENFNASNNSINAGNGDNFIYGSGSDVTITAGTGDDSIYFFQNYFGQPNETAKNLNIDAGDGNNWIYNGSSNSIIKTGAGNDYIYNWDTYVDDKIVAHPDNNTIDAGEGNDYILCGSNSKIDAGSGKNTISGYNTSDTLQIDTKGGYIVTRDGGNVLVSYGEDSVLLENFTEGYVNINGKMIMVGGSGGDNSVWEFKNKKATCKTDDGKSVEVKGVKSAEGLKLSGKKIIVTISSLGTSKVTASKGYTLELGDDVPEVELNEIAWSLKKNTATLKAFSTAGYSCDGTSITYKSASSGATLATITGINSIEGIEVSGNVITLPENALGTSNIKLTKGDYKLALADMSLTTATKEPSWIISGTKASYKDSTSAHYEISSNGKTISYVKATSDKKAKDLITLNGINKNLKASDIKIDDANKIVTLSANALNKKNVTIGGTYNYSLALANDVEKAEVGEPACSLNKTTATLSQKQEAGYVCNGSTITYSKKSATVTLATITGVNSINGIEISGNVITLPENSLGTSNIKLTKGDYKLALADTSLTTATKEPSWIISATKATYKDSTSAHYSIDKNGKTISYVKVAPDKNAKDLITLNGVNKNIKASDIEIDDANKTVTLSANALNKKNVTIGGTYGYSLTLDDDVSKSIVGKTSWSVKGTKATLQAATSEGYSCDGSTITYTKAKNGAAVATISGVKNGIKVTNGKISGISVDDDEKTINLSSNALSNKVTIGGDYEFDFASGYNKALIVGSKNNDSIKVFGSGMTIKGGKGDDSLWGSENADTFIYAKGDGKDVIYGFDDTDMLEITGTFSANYDKSANEIAFKVGSTENAITLQDFTATTFNVNGKFYRIKK